MAAAEGVVYTDAAAAVSQGKRHLLVHDYESASEALGEGCNLLAKQYGETADELGEPYLYYGRALLYLGREESGVLGTGVPGQQEEEDDDDEEEGEEGADGAEGQEEENGAEEKESDEKGDSEKAKSDETKVENGKHEDAKAEEAKTEESKPEASSASSASSSSEAGASSTKMTNGDASSSTAHQNGDAHDEAEGEEDEDEEDSGSNLQAAWEVLELAKLILLKRGPPGWKLLSEAHRLLGEVALESGNMPGALADLNACLDLLRKVEPADPRSIAETHYQLGLAHSLGSEFDEAIEQFKEATSLLENRIKELQSMTEPPKTDDPLYTIEGEINELKGLLPEIQEKIADTRDFKQQACKLMIEGIKSHIAGGSCSNGAGPSGEGSSGSSSAATSFASSSKPVSDISHLVRKKRKPEDGEGEAASPCKKPTPEKSA